MAWVLILTLNGYGLKSVSIDHVSGFKSAAMCQAAGNLWLKANSDGFGTLRAICVQQ